ncbi:sensor histidine kinase [Paenibacillus flagellatus]|uniref:histidine kinase n=1 Tax=Paenibacillus flagellatus TaxID=2211139 RepID=A0A2V5K7P9_9BACL|nr:ATP-binding protein [Paenibacillus flagellatus]PYI55461.1 two-component sensor histidine kinase [Paenibacillus flagellatus]
MSVSRKLFVAMASFIAAMTLLFAFVTQVVQKDVLDVMVGAVGWKKAEALADSLIDYYEHNGRSWTGVEQFRPADESWNAEGNASFLLLSTGQEVLYAGGGESAAIVKRWGGRTILSLEDRSIGLLYYYDPDVAYLSKLRTGVRDSMTFLLAAGGIAFVLVSLIVAYALSRTLTAPLRRLLPAIERLGKGEFGVQAPVRSGDEYGKVAAAFNLMSRQLERTEKARRHLVADVAHELRTPITILRGKLELVQQSGRPVEPENLLPLQDELIRLTRLVDDLHQLSLAEAGKLPFERKPTSMPALLRRVVDRIAPEAESKRIDVTLSGTDEGEPIWVDPNRIMQVFLNLLMNAVRYTPSGGSIRIAIERLPNEGGGFLEIRVIDTGIGIAPEHLPLLFDRFYRTDEARARNSGGTGLGLAIAKELVQLHGGTIEAESVPDRGTTFVVRLPQTRPQ